MSIGFEALEVRRLMSLGLGALVDLGGGAGDDVHVLDVANDRAGHVYVCGTFAGLVDFDVRRNHDFFLDTVRSDTFGAIGTDAFVAKFTADGRLVWARQLQFTGDSAGGRGALGTMAVEADGDVYLTGGFSGTVDFNPRRGRATLTAFASQEAFAWKLDADGSFRWATRLASPLESAAGTFGTAVAIDALGDAVVVGRTVSQGDDQFLTFVTRLFADTGDTAYGKFLTLSPTVDASAANALAADRDGFVYVTGAQVGGLAEGFLAKVNRKGNVIWSRSIGDTAFGTGGGQGVAVTRRGAVFVTGSFSGNAIFANKPRLSTGPTDAYLVRFDTEGDIDWVRSWGGQNGRAFGEDVAIDASDRVVVSGTFNQEVDFDTGNGRRIREAGDRDDFYVSRFHADGAFSTVATFGGLRGAPTSPSSISASRSGSVFLAGSFTRAVDFDPSSAAFEVDAGTRSHGFWLRLDEV